MTRDGAQDRFRPIGWWLKEADARLEAAFAAHLGQHGLSRRGWQVLAGAARRPVSRAVLVEELAGFDSAEELHRLVEQLCGQGLLDESGDVLRLTATGAELQLAAATEVEHVRAAVAQALPADDYRTLVELLGRLVDTFPPAPRAS